MKKVECFQKFIVEIIVFTFPKELYFQKSCVVEDENFSDRIRQVSNPVFIKTNVEFCVNQYY